MEIGLEVNAENIKLISYNRNACHSRKIKTANKFFENLSELIYTETSAKKKSQNKCMKRLVEE
jgi:hypothetical protein